MPKLEFERLQDTFSKDDIIDPSLFKPPVIEHVKQNILTGIPEARLSIDFQPEDGSDILIKKIDPEKALGYQVHDNIDEYYQFLQRDLYVPQDSDFLSGGNG